jgi:type II secretory pathway pseudopilin PulG
MVNKKVRRRSARGMTLVEVLISLLLGVVGLLGMLMLVLTLGSGSTFSRQLTEASVLAQSRLEELVSQTGVSLTFPPDGTFGAAETLDAQGRPGAGPFTRTARFVTINDLGGTRRRIFVRVAWNDNLNQPKFVEAYREKVAQ